MKKVLTAVIMAAGVAVAGAAIALGPDDKGVAQCCAAAGGVASAETKAAFERIKALAGDWHGTGKHGDEESPMSINYRVTSAGTAVVETLFPGTEHEMVSVYTLDGDALTLTHYCAMGNQPRLGVKPGADAKEFEFEWISGCNMASRDDRHMGRMVLTLKDEDRLMSAWTGYEGGEAKGGAVFEVERAKASAAR